MLRHLDSLFNFPFPLFSCSPTHSPPKFFFLFSPRLLDLGPLECPFRTTSPFPVCPFFYVQCTPPPFYSRRFPPLFRLPLHPTKPIGASTFNYPATFSTLPPKNNTLVLVVTTPPSPLLAYPPNSLVPQSGLIDSPFSPPVFPCSAPFFRFEKREGGSSCPLSLPIQAKSILFLVPPHVVVDSPHTLLFPDRGLRSWGPPASLLRKYVHALPPLRRVWRFESMISGLKSPFVVADLLVSSSLATT